MKRRRRLLVALLRHRVTGEATYLNASPTAITPTLGSELLTNGNFAAWTADNPDSWTVVDESALAAEVTQRGTGELNFDGLGNTGFANLFKDEVTELSPYIGQSVLTAGLWYRVTVLVDTYGGGALAVLDSSSGITISYDSPGSKAVTGRAAAAQLRFAAPANGTDVTIDNASAKRITNFMVAEDTHATALSYNQCALTITADTQAGVYQRHASSGDYVLAYINRADARVYLIKVVSGTSTVITSTAITYTAGHVLKLQHHVADGWKVYYASAAAIDAASPLITSTALTDTNLDTCDENGLFSTDAATTFANYKWSPN